MSWFPNARESQLGRWVSRLAEPYLEIFDRILPSVGGISFSVIAGIFVLQLAQRGLMVLLP